MMISKEKTSKTILIERDAYMYLHRIQREQRGCKPQTAEGEDRLWNKIHKVDGKYQAMDGSFGGGDGTYNGRWTSWSLEKIKKMITDAGYKYEEGEDVRYIDIAI